MQDYKQEQIIVVLTTTLSFITARSWNSVLEQYITEYYDDSLVTHVLSAIIVTIITIFFIDWLLKNMNVTKNKLQTVQKVHNLGDYIVK